MAIKNEGEAVEIKKILQEVANDGAYKITHVMKLEALADQKVTYLQQELRGLLDIRDCDHR